jgi:hypothetical protein
LLAALIWAAIALGVERAGFQRNLALCVVPPAVGALLGLMYGLVSENLGVWAMLTALAGACLSLPFLPVMLSMLKAEEWSLRVRSGSVLHRSDRLRVWLLSRARLISRFRL